MTNHLHSAALSSHFDRRNQLLRLKPSYGTNSTGNILRPNFDNNLPLSIIFKSARFHQDSFQGSTEIVSLKIIWYTANFEFLQQNLLWRQSERPLSPYLKLIFFK